MRIVRNDQNAQFQSNTKTTCLESPEPKRKLNTFGLVYILVKHLFTGVYCCLVATYTVSGDTTQKNETELCFLRSVLVFASESHPAQSN